MSGLSKTGIWPMDTQHQRSIREILDSPGFVEFECKIPPGTCASCSSNCQPAKIQAVRSKILSDFDGLCLDCMDLSLPKIDGDVDRDYWEHDKNRIWDVDCRISHSQPTWYFSFMGRRAEMKAHQLKKNQNFQKKRADDHRLGGIRNRMQAFSLGL